MNRQGSSRLPRGARAQCPRDQAACGFAAASKQHGPPRPRSPHRKPLQVHRPVARAVTLTYRRVGKHGAALRRAQAAPGGGAQAVRCAERVRGAAARADARAGNVLREGGRE